MTSSTRISVLVVTYNFEPYIEECVQSLVGQTLKPYEIIIADDLSTDNTRDKIEALAGRYPGLIVPCLPETKLGPAEIGNAGLDRIRGEWVSVMDGDDRWHPEKLEKEFLAIKKFPGAEIAYSNVRLINQHGSPTQIWHDDRKGLPPTGDVFTQTFSRQFFNNTGSIFRNHLVSQKAMRDIGLYYDARLNSFWDWDEKIRLTAKYQVAYSGGIYTDYRQHPGGMSHDRSDRNIVAMMEVYKKNKGLLSGRSLPERVFIMRHAESAIHELGVSINRASAEYTYEKIVGRLQQVVADEPETESGVRQKAIAMIRPLYVQDIAEKLNGGQNIRALESWIGYLKNDPNPIDLQINLPAQLHHVLQGTYRKMAQRMPQ